MVQTSWSYGKFKLYELTEKEAFGVENALIINGAVLLLLVHPLPVATVSVTEYVPAIVNKCIGFCKVEEVPSPKFHNQLVMGSVAFPVTEKSLN